jgi:indole-3-glycerol phosphate synthase
MFREIVESKKREVEAAKIQIPFAELEAMVAQEEPPRNFFAAVTRHATKSHMAVIAEIKRKSPSAGYFRPNTPGTPSIPKAWPNSITRAEPPRFPALPMSRTSMAVWSS